MGLKEARRGDRKFFFPALNKETFQGLPGLLADALPDKFGNSIIDTWLARVGRDRLSFNPIERLCYTGRRGMGAMEFFPAIADKKYDKSEPVDIAKLGSLAQEVMREYQVLNVTLKGSEKEHASAIIDILRVGTSAGGARPKAVIALNSEANIVSGQGEVPEGYEYWILKFDGVTDLEIGDSRGHGRIEYAYYLMAISAGINMTECRLLQENGRAHFMTRRFDRVAGKKLHMQSLCGIAHYDFNMAGAYSYEQVFEVMRRIRLSKTDMVEQYRRMIFSVIARNLDDHTKNIAFLMGEDGEWSLSPAYDVIYSHNPHGRWTNQHQMSIRGKRDHFTYDDLVFVGQLIGLKKPELVIGEVKAAVENWAVFASEAGVKAEIILEIAKNHRIKI